MIRAYLSQQIHLIPFALFALVLFVGLFFAMLLWLFRDGSRPIYERAASLPLQEEDFS